MAGYLVGQILMSFLLSMSAMQQGVLADTKHLHLQSHTGNNTRQHLYVVTSNPSGKAVIGKALTRLGYFPSDSSDPDTDSRIMAGKRDGTVNSGSYSYTDLSTSQEVLGDIRPVCSSGSDCIIIQQGHSESGHVSDTEGLSLELNLGAVEAIGKQAEKWVALCDFLGLGYSTVERLKLWEFP